MWKNNNWNEIKTHLTEPLSLLLVAIPVAVISLVVKEAAITWPFALLILVGFIILTIILLLLIRLLVNANELKSLTPRMTYYDVYGKNGDDEIFEITDKIIHEAEHEILILNWRVEERPDTGHRPDVRNAYFKDLLKKSENVVYKRVIQSRSYWPGTDAKRIADTYHETYVAHFKEMLKLQEKQKRKGESKIDLLIAPPSVPSTFVIVDSQYLIWQLNELKEPLSDSSIWKMRGAIVIYDPGKIFINNFKKTFEKVFNGNHRSISKTDLEKTPLT